MTEILLVVLTIFVFGVTFAYLLRFLRQSQASLERNLQAVTERVNLHLQNTAQLTQDTGAGTVKAISDVYTRLGKLEENTNKIYAIGEEISRLQTLLRAPKTRGGFGEWMLEDLLGQMIPKENFQIQYAFRNGLRVDAVLLVGGYLVPVDSKFPLENFERCQNASEQEERKKMRREFCRDVKKHVDAIAERYIMPGEGTLDFALMYIPSESVYYELIGPRTDETEFDLSAYALSKRVVPVSPNSFYAYLQMILMGLKGMRMDREAKEIAASLSQMRVGFKKVITELEVLGSHWGKAQGSYDRLLKEINRFDVQLEKLEALESPVPDKIEVVK